MNTLTNEQQKSYKIEKNCYICKEKVKEKHTKDNNHCKYRDHCHYTREYRRAVRYLFRKNTEKYITFSVPIKKKLQELIKKEKKLQKPNPADYDLLIAQHSWQAHYQVL